LLSGETHVIYTRRWFHLLLYCMLNIGNAIVWISFSPISDKVKDYYHIDDFWINMLSTVFLIAYIPVVPFASWCMDMVNLRFGLVLGAVFTVVGAWLRVPGKWTFWTVLAGQTLGAIGQGFILNAPPKLAANWFPDSQRTTATTLGSLANPIGVAIGFVLPPAVVTVSGKVPLLMLIEAGIVSALCVPLILFFRSAAPTPPSGAADVVKEENFVHSLKEISTNLNFWLLFFEFGLGLGAYNTLATVINEICKPFGYSNTDSGVLGAVTIVSGLVGAGIVGPLVDKTRAYKLFLVLCMVSSVGSALLLLFAMKPHNLVVIAIACGWLGFSITPILPVTLELAVETTFPIGEATPSGVLMVSGQILGAAMIFTMDYFIDKKNIRGVSGWYSVLLLCRS